MEEILVKKCSILRKNVEKSNHWREDEELKENGKRLNRAIE